MVDTAMVDKNIDSVATPLSEKEKQVLEYITRKFFDPLDRRDWEDKEPLQYWQERKNSK